jgi:D-methionine transport system ATP-binding protein
MIELRQINKTFQRKGVNYPALKNINLSVEKGDIYGIIGYSGAGKSTLLRLINGLEKPSSGDVIVNQQVLSQFTARQLREIRKDIGMIFQHFNLLNSKTVYQNIAIPLILLGKDKKQIEQRVNELLLFVGLEDKAHHYPDELSGGQKQRVGIARALATNPSILLCDEATSALDPQTTVQILLLLQRINHQYNITILLITHEMSVIQKICRHVAVMEQGEIIEQGRVLDLFSHPQHHTTANFVRTVIHDNLPAHIRQQLQHATDQRCFRLEFVGESANQPVIYHTIQRFAIEVTILFASMSEIQSVTVGFMMVKLRATDEQIALGVDYLTQQGVNVQEITPCLTQQ